MTGSNSNGFISNAYRSGNIQQSPSDGGRLGVAQCPIKLIIFVNLVLQPNILGEILRLDRLLRIDLGGLRGWLMVGKKYEFQVFTTCIANDGVFVSKTRKMNTDKKPPGNCKLFLERDRRPSDYVSPV